MCCYLWTRTVILRIFGVAICEHRLWIYIHYVLLSVNTDCEYTYIMCWYLRTQTENIHFCYHLLLLLISVSSEYANRKRNAHSNTSWYCEHRLWNHIYSEFLSESTYIRCRYLWTQTLNHLYFMLLSVNTDCESTHIRC